MPDECNSQFTPQLPAAMRPSPSSFLLAKKSLRTPSTVAKYKWQHAAFNDIEIR